MIPIFRGIGRLSAGIEVRSWDTGELLGDGHDRSIPVPSIGFELSATYRAQGPSSTLSGRLSRSVGKRCG
ncbi:hypothetical protein GCM10010449_11010 [Streptomyces rectiviolaceus]|uniref:Uncharacterized protein n=1 Tax=Streptomyces rectiviolaceus TaxID=332591 RepID=A0ABP6M8L1_9ACTN